MCPTARDMSYRHEYASSGSEDPRPPLAPETKELSKGPFPIWTKWTRSWAAAPAKPRLTSAKEFAFASCTESAMSFRHEYASSASEDPRPPLAPETKALSKGPYSDLDKGTRSWVAAPVKPRLISAKEFAFASCTV